MKIGDVLHHRGGQILQIHLPGRRLAEPGPCRPMLATMLTRMLTMAAPALTAMAAKRDNAFMPSSLLPVADLVATVARGAKTLLSTRTATV